MRYYVYVAKSKDGFLYKGMTSDLAKRMTYHNKGLGNWTRSRGPFELVYYEKFCSKREALKRRSSSNRARAESSLRK